MAATALDGVSALIDGGQLAEAAEAVRRLWSASREPALAKLLDCFPSRARPRFEDGSSRGAAWVRALHASDALMMPALLAELGAMLSEEEPRNLIACLRALATRPGDPRVGEACVRWLLDPARVHALDTPIYRELERALEHHLDPRHADTLRAFAQRNPAWANQLGRTTKLPALTRVVYQRYRVEPRLSLAPGLVRQIAELRERIRRLPDELARPSIAAAAARVRSHPLDEAARGVLRDMLLEAADPWGELMVLQEARARSGGPCTEEETQLLLEVGPRLLGTLTLQRSGLVVSPGYSRGFLTEVGIHAHVHEVAAVMAHAELSTLERVTFYDAAAITPNLVVLKEAHGVTLADLGRAARQAPAVKLSAVTIKNASAHELALQPFWPELRELYTLDRDSHLDELLALSAAGQLTAIGIVDRPAPNAFDRFHPEMLSLAPASVQKVRYDVFGRRAALRVNWLRADGGWRAEIAGYPMTVSRDERNAAGELDLALPALRRCLRGLRSVTFSSSVSPRVREALER